MLVPANHIVYRDGECSICADRWLA